MCFFAAVTKVGWSQNPPLWQVRCDSKTKLCKTVWIWARRGQARMFGYWNQSTHPFRYLLVLYCWVQRCPINGAVSSLETTVSSVFWYQRMFLYIWLSLIAFCHPQARSCGGPGARESESERERESWFFPGNTSGFWQSSKSSRVARSCICSNWWSKTKGHAVTCFIVRPSFLLAYFPTSCFLLVNLLWVS